MTTARRWTFRAVLAGVLFAVSYAGLSLLKDDPDPLRLALCVVLIVCAGALLVDGAPVESSFWPVHPLPTVGLGRADPRTATYVRMLEGHLTAGEPDPALRERLRLLTDQVLRIRTDLSVDDPRAEDVIGPELLSVLTGPPRRLRPEEIERCVRRIEEL